MYGLSYPDHDGGGRTGLSTDLSYKQGLYKKRPKNQGLFKDFPAPNNFIPGPFYFHWKCFEHSNAKMGIAQTIEILCEISHTL